MNRIVCYDSDGAVIDHFTQWDIGQKITITGATTTSAPDFHFCNPQSAEALVTPSSIVGESIIAEVPDTLLQEALPLTVHMYYQVEECSAKTVYTFTIPVYPRQKPAGYTYEEARTDHSVLLNLIYPVGALYLSANNISPDSFLVGQWEQLENSFLVSSEDTYTSVYAWKRIS